MKTLIIAFFTLLLSSLSTKAGSTSLDNAKLKGKVKSVTTYQYNVKSNDRTYTRKSIVEYDVHGNEVKQTIFHGNTYFYSYSYTYTYNDAGYKTEAIRKADGDPDYFIEKYTYDEYNRLTEMKLCVKGDTLCDRTVYKYDTKGNKIEWNRYNGDSVLLVQTTFSYSSTGNLIASDEGHIADREVLGYYTKYDEKGYPIFYRRTLIKEVREFTYTPLSFDRHGNWTKQRCVSKSGSVTSTDTVDRTITYY